MEQQEQPQPPSTSTPPEAEAAQRKSFERKVVGTSALAFIAFIMGGFFLMTQLSGSSDEVVLPLSGSAPAPEKDVFSFFKGRDPATNPYIEKGKSFLSAEGVVTDVVTRSDRMPDGRKQLNYYARTEYLIPKFGMICYFHHYLGPENPAPTYYKNLHVTVAYQPDASDACGSSMISVPYYRP